MIEEQPQPQGMLNWLKESVTVKLIFIGVLILLLLIPSAMVDSLINERAGRQEETIKQVSDQYSGSQQIKGPVLIIPYKMISKQKDKAGKESVTEEIDNLYILPNELHYQSKLNTELLHRGIYDVAVYNTSIHVSGDFVKAELSALSLSADQLMPEKAQILFSITDLKGLKTNPQVKVGEQTISAEPAFSENIFPDGLKVGVNLKGLLDKPLPFEFVLQLKGSEELSFLHLGKTTDVELTINWPSPVFGGRYLPDERKIDNYGFTAKWRMLYYNRPFPQQWVNDNTLLTNAKKIDEATFGVKLKLPVDQYQKTMRTSKYSILIILLTFISLFLTELIGKQKVHVFNYILIGVAMIIFYILLLSISEQIGYTLAYLVASVATVGLITTFLASILKNRKAALLFSIILTIFYAFIYVIIQLEDLALLIGSIALFFVVSALMYFSRKINWDKQ